jgi:hypothetical protein
LFSLDFYLCTAEMKLLLDSPIFFSKDSIYVSNVKETDVVLLTEGVDLSKTGQVLSPTAEQIESTRVTMIEIIQPQILTWFTTPITLDKLRKNLKFEFAPFEYTPESRWVSVRWVPKHFKIQTKGFVLLFSVQSFVESNPRIPLSFLESTTPRASTPEDAPLVRNIVVRPGAIQIPSDLIESTDIPLSESHASMEIEMDDKKSTERQRLRQAKLRAAIARLKVEEMRERYIREYGDVDDENEDSDDSSLESE